MRNDCEDACMAKIEAETTDMCQRLTDHAPGLKWEGMRMPYVLVMGHMDQSYMGTGANQTIALYWNNTRKGWFPRLNHQPFSNKMFKTPEEAIDATLVHATKMAKDILEFCKIAKRETP